MPQAKKKKNNSNNSNNSKNKNSNTNDSNRNNKNKKLRASWRDGFDPLIQQFRQRQRQLGVPLLESWLAS